MDNDENNERCRRELRPPLIFQQPARVARDIKGEILRSSGRDFFAARARLGTRHPDDALGTVAFWRFLGRAPE
jgi:hypothetical protein